MIKRMRRIHAVHFVGIGGSGMSGIAEVMLRGELSDERLKGIGGANAI